MDHAELAARAAVACWNGSEGTHALAVRSTNELDLETLTRFLNVWMLARSNPLERRAGLLAFLNQHAMPALKVMNRPSEPAYRLIETLSDRAQAEQVTKGRPTSMLSKLGHAVSPIVFIPYDSRVQKALRSSGKGIRAHCYFDYMQAVLSEMPALQRELTQRGLSAQTLNATGMSQELFELRALDKWLMLRGGFSTAMMSREL